MSLAVTSLKSSRYSRSLVAAMTMTSPWATKEHHVTTAFPLMAPVTSAANLRQTREFLSTWTKPRPPSCLCCSMETSSRSGNTISTYTCPWSLRGQGGQTLSNKDDGKLKNISVRYTWYINNRQFTLQNSFEHHENLWNLRYCFLSISVLCSRIFLSDLHKIALNLMRVSKDDYLSRAHP